MTSFQRILGYYILASLVWFSLSQTQTSSPRELQDALNSSVRLLRMQSFWTSIQKEENKQVHSPTGPHFNDKFPNLFQSPIAPMKRDPFLGQSTRATRPSQASTPTLDTIYEAWVNTYLSGRLPLTDHVWAMTSDLNGDIIIAGSIFDPVSGADYMIIKYSSSGQELWNAQYKGRDNEYPSAIQADNQGNVYVTGSSAQFWITADYVTVKYSSDGIEQWAALYDGPGHGEDQATAICLDKFGNVYVSGCSEGLGTSKDYATVKYTSDGQMRWVARKNGPANGWDWAFSMVIDALGNIIVGGSSEDTARSYSSNPDFLTIKYDTAGNELWSARFAGPSGRTDYVTAVAVDNEDNAFITGMSEQIDGTQRYTTIKYSPSGTCEWIAVGPDGFRDPIAIGVDHSGKVVVTGTAGDSIGTVQYNPDGSLRWSRRYPGTMGSSFNATDLVVDTLGNVYISGATNGPQNNSDFVALKYDSSGHELWASLFGLTDESYDVPIGIALGSSGDVFLSGSSGSGIFTTIKYSPDGILGHQSQFQLLGGTDEIADAIAIDERENVYVVATSQDSSRWDILTVKYDTSGEQEWASRYKGVSGVLNDAGSLAIDKLGNVFVTTHCSSDLPSIDIVTIKYNAQGIEQWSVRRSPSEIGGYASPVGIGLDSAGYVYVAGNADRSTIVIKYNQDGSLVWERTVDDPAADWDWATVSAVDSQGNVYVTGATGDFGEYDYLTLKFNSSGDLLWKRTYDGGGSDQAAKLAISRAGNVYVSGYSENNGLATIKYNPAGVQEWIELWNESPVDIVSSIAVDKDEYVYLAGSTVDSSYNDFFLTIKYDSNGTEQWVRKYRAPGESQNRAEAMTLDDSGKVYITGWTYISSLNYDIMTLKYDPVGELEWVTTYDDPRNQGEYPMGIAVGRSGAVYVAGTSYVHLQIHPLITIKYGLQATSFSTLSHPLSKGWNLISLPLIPKKRRLQNLVPNSESKAISYDGIYKENDLLEQRLGYWVKAPHAGFIDFLGTQLFSDTIRVDIGWNLIGSISKSVPLSGIDSDPPGIELSRLYTFHDKYYTMEDTIKPGRGYWIKSNSAGNLILSATPSTVATNRVRIFNTSEMPPPAPDIGSSILQRTPTQFALHQNYPNPFNPITTIRYDLPEVSSVSIRIFNTLGQEIVILANEEQMPGFREVSWNAASASSGVYFVRFVAGGFMETKKLILMK